MFATVASSALRQATNNQTLLMNNPESNSLSSSVIGVITSMASLRAISRETSLLCSSWRAAIALTGEPPIMGAAKEKTAKAKVAKMERVNERIVNECGRG